MKSAKFEKVAGACVLIVLAVLGAAVPVVAQEDPVEQPAGDPIGEAVADSAVPVPDTLPRPLTPDAYGQWERLENDRLSPDGEWLTVEVARVNDEDELRIHRVASDSVVVIPYGSRATFSGDGRWVAYSIWYPDDEVERLRQSKDSPRSKLGMLDLVRGDTALVPGVSSFAFSDDSRWLAMRRYPVGDAKGEDEFGADLVVRDLATGTDVNFGNVGEFAWQDDGRLLAMTVDAAGNAGNGVRVWDPRSGAIRVLESRAADYTELRWREDADDLLVMRVIEDEDREEKSHAVLTWRDVSGRAERRAFEPGEHDGFPADTRIVAHRAPEFSDDGRSVFFGIQAWEPTEAPDSAGDEPAADSASDEEAEAGVEVWHSRDVDIIPRQKMTASMDRDRNELAVWHMDGDRFVRLGGDYERGAQRIHGDRYVLGLDGAPYDQERMFGPEYQDAYLIDTRTGERRKVLERIEHFFGASPAGRYLLYLEDDQYRVYSIRDDRTIDLTSGLPTVFVDTADDHTVEQKPPFRYAGWTEGDRSVVLHDRYDAWEVRPDGSGGRRLTDGRADRVIHRYNRVGWTDGQEAIDRDAPVYWNLTGEWSKRNGYGVASRLDRAPERRIWLDASVTRLSKAEDADVFAWMVQDFDDSPDYFVSTGRVGSGRQVTASNAFQGDYTWGRSELIEFENEWGKRLQGALFYPADYEPGRRYPMITYIYETRSPTVHTYYVPDEESEYNPAVWTSQGYFVFQPDIVYRPRNPGLSAVEALVPAVEAAVATGMVDPERVGLIGHSWGGYQTAFVPTQTDIFAAAVAGAPLTELTSMYLSIYWNVGGTDARIFEISQGRMEVPPWEDLASYQANSPVHHIETLNTPMLVAFGDQDGAVDWDQGIVFYNAARRAGKEMVLLVYEGENHGLSKKPNQVDYHRRINEWFGHYLKGEPAAAWMSTGVPYLEQEEGKAAPGS